MGRRLLQVLLLSGMLSIIMPPLLAQASGSWTSGEFSWGEKKKIASDTQSEGCQNTRVNIIGVTSLPEVAQVCVYERPDFRYAAYNKYINLGYGGYTQNYFVVSIGSDHNMYVVENMSGQRMPLNVPGSDDLHFNTLTMGFTNNHLLTYIPDFRKKLHKTSSFGEPTKYQLNEGSEQRFISSDQDVTTGAVGVSDDGDWMAVEVMGVGLVRIDTATRKLYGFSNYVHRYGMGSDAHITFRISNDGTKVAAFDYNISPVIYTLDSSCLLVADRYNEVFSAQLHDRTCITDNGRLQTALTEHYTYQLARGMSASGFNLDGDTLYFDNYVYEDENDWMNPTVYRTPLYAGGYRTEVGIDYLALGDSFTSGEGDIETTSDGSTYYLKGTENKGQCHMSSRSYPFVLRGKLDISQARMHSVACSGAEVLPDYMGETSTYLGQGKRLAHLSASNRKSTQELALSTFAPGNLPQLEFIRKYQPKTITLMGGGNDVGFARIVEYCASPSWQMIFINDTCGYAVKGSHLRNLLAQSIQNQYEYTLRLLAKVRQASPATTVYVIGYPSFISEKRGINCFNSAVLNDDERVMINEGVDFMNSALKAAAESMGVHYVNIQNVLEGGRLCEGSEYVTGIGDISYDLQDYGSNIFHPNAKAHTKIAQHILSQGFQVKAGDDNEMLAEPLALSLPSYFDGVEQKQVKQQKMIASPVTEGGSVAINVPEGALAASSTATLTIFSDPINLGSVSVSATGSVDASIVLPSSLKPGRHVLTLDGQTPTGEPIEYFQFVTIASRAPSDEDGDGIIDINDRCPFFTSWIDEKSQKDVCIDAPAEVGKIPSDDSKHGASPRSSLNIDQRGSSIPDRISSKIATAPTSQSKEEAGNGDSSGKVLGVHDVNKLVRGKEDYSGARIGVVAAVLLSTFVVSYGIVRYIRKKYD